MSKKDVKKDLLAQDEISDLKQGHKDKALSIVKEILPKKVKELTAGLETGPLFKHDLKQVSAGFTIEPSLEASRKKRKLDETTSMEVDGTKKPEHNIPINKPVSDIIETLKKEILFFVEQINVVKLWIQLNIPRIEDGNNFGVSIQEEALNELTRAEDSAFTSLDQMTKYFVTRAKLVAKCIKYPQIQDYHQSVVELDEKEYIDLRVSWKDLRNNYAILYDVIMKNFEKIIRPRSDNSVTLY